MLSHALLTWGLSLASICNALPTEVMQERETEWTWDEGATNEYPIHVSCNATERSQLQRAFNESITLAQHAKDHIMRYGNSSDTYVKYFGSSPTAEPAGWYDKVVNGDKTAVLFRCDDIDNKCSQDGWAGHWRGEIAPDQTVICPLSFEARWPLEAMCGHGYTVAAVKDSQYFAADLLHRLYHTVKIAEGIVDHYADTQEEILQLAIEHPEQAVRNSATLRHFAVEVYAYDIALPGQGCAGKAVDSGAALAASSTVTTAVTASQTALPSATSAEAATTTSSAAQECHTHGDGFVHCA